MVDEDEWEFLKNQQADDYALNNYELIEIGQRTDEIARKEGFVKGADFGYKKANDTMKELLKEAIHLLKNSDELYGYQVRDFWVKCIPFIKED